MGLIYTILCTLPQLPTVQYSDVAEPNKIWNSFTYFKFISVLEQKGCYLVLMHQKLHVVSQSFFNIWNGWPNIFSKISFQIRSWIFHVQQQFIIFTLVCPRIWLWILLEPIYSLWYFTKEHFIHKWWCNILDHSKNYINV